MKHALFLLIVSALGCATKSPEVAVAKPTPKPAEKLPKVTDRPANTDGVVFIVEYHRISKEEARWDRSISAFKKDLERLYKLGFRPVTLTSYLNNTMKLGPGASPVVFTFDDSQESQLKMLPDGSLDPSCAVAIWQAFAAKHPDFPVRATFFVLPPTPWAQGKFLDQKLKLLKSLGCELGSHTATHHSLAKMGDEEVKKEIGDSLDRITAWGFDYNAISLPFGISPKNKQLLKGFTRNGKTYSLRAAVLVGSNPAPSPNSTARNPYRLPRIQSIEGDFGITYWLDRVADGRVKPYVAP